MALPTRRLFPQLILTTTIASSCRIPFTEAFSIRLHPPSSQPRGVHLPPMHQSGDGSAESSGQSITGSIYEMDGSSVVVKLFTKEGCTLCDKVKDVLESIRDDQPHSLYAVDITDDDKHGWFSKYKLAVEDAIAGLQEARSGSFEARSGEPDAERLEHS
ncbi:predicted protein [Thalassiosira pseudonana CCMP1335]|uniref:Glutaredoxin-like protein n=1 Tax=Thalassiosira pseudonana TaxID=35128 RepID=B8C2C7_THAPS|nr:predicted protein [Thalassiosira pseudonana CCMP1335]EED91927.1 predicted protein [Thalassiosira pseudonana CCMP1335]